jgi:hypothetical protein
MRFSFVILAVVLVLFCVSCNSKPSSTNEVIEVIIEDTSIPQDDILDPSFDPLMVSHQHYISTREEVQRFIQELNLIIRNMDYEAWRESLSSEYFAEISSEENLHYWSESPALTSRRIVLRTPHDYFIHVVVPSRANSRVDDIELISENRVKAFTVNINRAGEEQWLRLYDLEKINNKWTIIN